MSDRDNTMRSSRHIFFEVHIQMDLRRKDPHFTEYEPRNAAEAVELYYKLRHLNRIPFDTEPEVFQKLAKNLDQKEFTIFVNWLQNPLNVPEGSMPDPLPASGYIQREVSQDDEKHQ